jgi:hypothetical protein
MLERISYKDEAAGSQSAPGTMGASSNGKTLVLQTRNKGSTPFASTSFAVMV